MTSICIIPARGGSTRIKNKNTREFLGKPVLAYSIEAAEAAGIFDRITVNTEDDRIGGLVSQLGATFYKRPPELATDLVPMVDVILEQLETMQRKGLTYDAVCMVYACAPLITPKLLIDGYNRIELGYDVVFPIVEGPHIENTMFIRNQRLLNRFPEYENENSQLWTDAYYHAGMFFWARVDSLEGARSFNLPNRWGVIVPAHRAQDIDTPEDWALAEMKYKAAHSVSIGDGGA